MSEVVAASYQFGALIVIALTFSVASLIKSDFRLIAKLIAGISWFVLCFTQIFFFGGTNLLIAPFMFLFLGFGLVFCFSIVSDFRQQKRDNVYGWMDD